MSSPAYNTSVADPSPDYIPPNTTTTTATTTTATPGESQSQSRCRSRLPLWLPFSRCQESLIPTLRPLPILTTAPALTLFVADLHRPLFPPSSSSSHPQSSSTPPTKLDTPSLILDIFCITFLSLAIIWAVLCSALFHHPSHQRVHARIFAWVDIFFWVALLTLGNTTLGMRSSWHTCGRYVGSCEAWVIGGMRAAGGLMVVAA